MSLRAPGVPLLALILACLSLTACPDDVASTDLAQPKDQAVAVDLGGKD